MECCPFLGREFVLNGFVCIAKTTKAEFGDYMLTKTCKRYNLFEYMRLSTTKTRNKKVKSVHWLSTI